MHRQHCWQLTAQRTTCNGIGSNLGSKDRVEEARCVQHARSTEKDAMSRVALLQHLQIAALLKRRTANNKRHDVANPNLRYRHNPLYRIADSVFLTQRDFVLIGTREALRIERLQRDKQRYKEQNAKTNMVKQSSGAAHRSIPCENS